MLNFSKLSLLLFLGVILLQADQNLSLVLKKLDKRLETLEKKSDFHKGVINLRSSDTTMILGGRIQLDSIYLSTASGKAGGNNSSDNFFNANNIPLKKQGETSELALSARNSKFWIKTRTSVDDIQPLMTLLEVDFWGSNANEKNSNSYGLRLRHAYFDYMGWTIGQTNSAFTGSAKPSTLRAPVDDVFVRQPVIRYTHTLKHGSLSLSLEQPESLIMISSGDIITVNDDRLPDLILNYQRYGKYGEFSLSLLARELRIDEEIKGSVFGYGVHFSQKIKTWGNDDIRFSLLGGKGIGRYFATSFFPGATINERGELEAELSYGGHIAYQRWWSRNLRSNFAYGIVESDNNLPLADIDKSANSLHIDIQYTPIKNLMLACEYIHATRESQEGKSSDVDRLYLHASYDF